MVRRLQELVAELDSIHGDHNQAHVLVRLWNEERDRTARMARFAAACDFRPRTTELTAEQGRLVAQVTEAALADLHLDQTQVALAKKALARHLRLAAEDPGQLGTRQRDHRSP